MGYRHYLYAVDKELVGKIRKCKTKEELITLMKTEAPDSVSDGSEDEDSYVRLYDIGKKLFEFGKYYPNADNMYEHGDSLFTSDELNKKYADYGAIIIDPDGLKCAIDWERQHVAEIYEDLLREKSVDPFDDRSQELRMRDHAESYLRWWKYDPANMDMSSENIVSSWLYEHEYFELVRIYKTFNWGKSQIMFMGW